MRTGRILLLPFALLIPAFDALGWTAYNDLAWGKGQLAANITTYTVGQAGPLLDFHTGAKLEVALALNDGGHSHATQGINPADGTDARAIFGGIVDCVGAIAYSPTDSVLRVTGLDPARLYDLALYGDRDGAAYATHKKRRLTKCTLSDVDGFVNVSSQGATFSGPSDPSAVVLNGFNAKEGLVAWFTDIAPGEDGDLQVTVADGGSAEPPGYYVNALRIRTAPEPAGAVTFALGAALFALRARAGKKS